MPQAWLTRLLRPLSDPSKRREGRDQTARGPRDGEPRPPPRTLSTSLPLQRTRRLLGRLAHEPSSSSSLFLALPIELRLEILRQVVGGHAVHLVQRMNRLVRITHRRCTNHVPRLFYSDNIECSCIPCNSGCFPYAHLAPIDLYELDALDQSIVSLLLTCRSVYREAIELLYTANTFTLTDSDKRILYPVIPLESLARIRRLHITWGSPDLHLIQREFDSPECREYYKGHLPYQQWMWASEAVVTRLTSLKYLKVILHGKKRMRTFEPISCTDVEHMLAPLRRLRGLRSFEVLVMSDLEGYADIVAEMRKVVCAKA